MSSITTLGAIYTYSNIKNKSVKENWFRAHKIAYLTIDHYVSFTLQLNHCTFLSFMLLHQLITNLH